MRRALAALLAVLLFAVAAWADGGIYARQAVVKPVRTPDQRALLRWDEATGTETLVIETTLQGEGTEFAWILPLPAAPTIEASTTGLFPTLAVMCAPRVWTETEGTWALLLVLPWAVGLYLATRRAGIGGGCAVYLLGGIVVGIAAISLPTMQASDRGAASSVRVLSRETVGAFDTVTLQTSEASDLRRWLDANGFGAPPAIDPVVAEYVREGWVFVASKVRADAAADGVRRVHPLAFTFPAKSSVYPMRLTGATNETLALELYVAGDRRAEADGMEVEHCEDVEYALKREPTSSTHEELLRRAGGARVLTKLTGTLTGRAMHDDVAVRWTDFTWTRRTYRTTGVALAESGAAAGVGFFLTMLAATFVRGLRRARGREWTDALVRLDVRICAAVAAVVFLVAWNLTPRLPDGGHSVDRDARASWPFQRASLPTEPIRGVAAARAWAAGLAAGHTNPFTDEPIREEDSPGNYVICDREGRVELVTYEAHFGQVGQYAEDLSAPRPASR